MNKKPKYPWSLFFIGFLINLIKRIYLLAAAAILIVLGIFLNYAFIIGIALLTLNIVISLIEQFQIRHVALNSDDPLFKEWQDAILSENWRENIHTLIEGKIGDEADFVSLDNFEILNKCKKLLDTITESLFSLYRENDCSYFDSISKEESTDAIIDLFVKVIIPDLEYIKETLENDYILNKRKIQYADIIKERWSKESNLYVDLMNLYKGIPD